MIQKVSKYLDWVADQFGMVVDAPWTIFEDQKFWKRKLNVWSLIIWSQEGNRMIEYQKYWKSSIRVSAFSSTLFHAFASPLDHLIIWTLQVKKDPGSLLKTWKSEVGRKKPMISPPAIRRISTARQSIQLTWCHN